MVANMAVHNWKVYAKDNLVYVLQDGRLTKIFGIKKKWGKTRVGDDVVSYDSMGSRESVVAPGVYRDPPKSSRILEEGERQAREAELRDLEPVVEFNDEFFYTHFKDNHFEGLARRVDAAGGGIAHTTCLTPDEADRLAGDAEDRARSARDYLDVGMYKQATMDILYGLNANSRNEKLRGLLEELVKHQTAEV